MLSLNNLSYSLKNQFCIFSTLNLNFNNKTTYFILGPNGCGKSSLIKLMMGFMSPTQGKVHLHAESFNYIPPHNELHPCLKVSDLIELLLDTNSDFLKSKIYRDLDLDQISPHSYLSQISSGQRQRLVIGINLFRPTCVDFFDEPFNHLDYYYQNQTLKLLNEQKKLRFIVSHNLQDALHIDNSHILLIDQKKVLDLGPSTLALTKPEVQNVFKMNIELTKNPINGKKLLAVVNYEQ